MSWLLTGLGILVTGAMLWLGYKMERGAQARSENKQLRGRVQNARLANNIHHRNLTASSAALRERLHDNWQRQ